MTTNFMLSLYRSMLIIRQCEELLAKSHQRGLIHGACHTYVGQEAIATGVGVRYARSGRAATGAAVGGPAAANAPAGAPAVTTACAAPARPALRPVPGVSGR